MEKDERDSGSVKAGKRELFQHLLFGAERAERAGQHERAQASWLALQCFLQGEALSDPDVAPLTTPMLSSCRHNLARIEASLHNIRDIETSRVLCAAGLPEGFKFTAPNDSSTSVERSSISGGTAQPIHLLQKAQQSGPLAAMLSYAAPEQNHQHQSCTNNATPAHHGPPVHGESRLSKPVTGSPLQLPPASLGGRSEQPQQADKGQAGLPGYGNPTAVPRLPLLPLRRPDFLRPAGQPTAELQSRQQHYQQQQSLSQPRQQYYPQQMQLQQQQQQQQHAAAEQQSLSQPRQQYYPQQMQLQQQQQQQQHARQAQEATPHQPWQPPKPRGPVATPGPVPPSVRVGAGGSGGKRNADGGPKPAVRSAWLPPEEDSLDITSEDMDLDSGPRPKRKAGGFQTAAAYLLGKRAQEQGGSSG
eukprot:CAMPEP_0206149686 /NCGR_PEP_ID=MMETSP1473-20131121/37914_1 /ASSEMBLY_ACC=CAM_ASM_001109 /TAXON_ID=1461547 /ORGANISM="Stichococcus sp, Strain RCC1054" /LENGTH=416 /DNA_ID=CAMNT_0053547167 /DNA_START=189 /DNA_END=1435 /DNA_ORIENTATION=-